MRINFFAPVNTLGMGRHALGTMRALEALGNEICLIPPFGNVSFEDEQIRTMLDRKTSFTPEDPSVMIFDIDWFTQFSGRPRVGFAVFETDGFTPSQKASLKSCDILLTPSKWGQRVLAANGIKAHVVHEGYDPQEIPVAPAPAITEPVRFVSVGKLEERKGTLQLLRCFADALKGREAELILHIVNQFDQNSIQTVMQQLVRLGFMPVGNAYGMLCMRNADLVVRVTPGHVDSTVPLYQMADCGIFPTKGEAWGLPILECLVSGVPVIAGNWSGQSEYMGEDYQAELSLKGSPARAMDGVWFHGNKGDWIVPDDGDLKAKIQWAFQNARALRASQAWQEKVKTFRSFTWEAAAKELQKAILT